jgi:uncharacterized protein (DUF302 family)
MYHFSQTVNLPFEEAIAQVTAALKQEGFGVLTEIDVKATLKKKIDVDFPKYRILGACHPHIAHQMLQIDNKAGVLYPCNVVIQEHEDGQVEVSAINPEAMFQDIEKPEAKEVAHQAAAKMQAVMANLASLSLFISA